MYGLKKKDKFHLICCVLPFRCSLLFSVYASASYPVFSAVFPLSIQSFNSACVYIAPMAPTTAITIWMQPLFCMFLSFILVI